MVEALKAEHKQVAKGTLWSLAGQVFMKLIAFVYLVIVARLLSPDDIGVFYLAFSIVSAITIFSDLGFSFAFSRYVPYFFGRKEDEKVYSLLSGGYLLAGIVSLVLAFAVFAAAAPVSSVLKSPALESPLKFFALYTVICTFFSINNLYLQGRKKIKESNILLNFQASAKLLLTLALFFFFERSAVSLVAGFVGSFLIALLLSFWYMREDISRMLALPILQKMREHLALYREVIFFGLALSLVASLYALMGYTDKILLSYILPENESAAAIGIYTVAISLSSLVILLPSAVSSIFLPVISELHGKGKKEEMLAVSNTATRWVLFLLMPFTLIFLVFPDHLLQAFYGSAYVAGATALAIFTFGTFVRFLAFIHGYLLAAVRLIKIELTVAFFAAIMNVALNFLLIPGYGIEGAATASAVSLMIVAVLLVYYTRKLFGFTFPRDFYKPLLAGILALLFIFLVKGYILGIIDRISEIPIFPDALTNSVVNKLIQLAILGVLFLFTCLVYGIALLLMKAFAKEDIALMSAGLKKARVPDEFILMAERMMAMD